MTSDFNIPSSIPSITKVEIPPLTKIEEPSLTKIEIPPLTKIETLAPKSATSEKEETHNSIPKLFDFDIEGISSMEINDRIWNIPTTNSLTDDAIRLGVPTNQITRFHPLSKQFADSVNWRSIALFSSSDKSLELPLKSANFLHRKGSVSTLTMKLIRETFPFIAGSRYGLKIILTDTFTIFDKNFYNRDKKYSEFHTVFGSTVSVGSRTKIHEVKLKMFVKGLILHCASISDSKDSDGNYIFEDSESSYVFESSYSETLVTPSIEEVSNYKLINVFLQFNDEYIQTCFSFVYKSKGTNKIIHFWLYFKKHNNSSSTNKEYFIYEIPPENFCLSGLPYILKRIDERIFGRSRDTDYIKLLVNGTYPIDIPPIDFVLSNYFDGLGINVKLSNIQGLWVDRGGYPLRVLGLDYERDKNNPLAIKGGESTTESLTWKRINIKLIKCRNNLTRNIPQLDLFASYYHNTTLYLNVPIVGNIIPSVAEEIAILRKEYGKIIKRTACTSRPGSRGETSNYSGDPIKQEILKFITKDIPEFENLSLFQQIEILSKCEFRDQLI